MVTANHAWEEETRKYLADIQTELVDIDKRLEELQAKRDALAHEAEAFNTALASHLRRTGREQIRQPDMRDLLTNQPNHKARIKRIAEYKNGVLKVGEAANLLYTHRIIKTKSKMNAYRIVYALALAMVDEGVFKRSAPGEFRLLDTQPALPARTTAPK